MRALLCIAVLSLIASRGPALSSPLDGRSFEAVRISGALAKGDKPPTIAFEGAKASGTGGCNQYGAVAASDGRVVRERIRHARRVQQIWTGSVRFDQLTSTRMDCGPASVQEGRFFAQLRQARHFRLGRDALRIYSATNRRSPILVLRAVN